MWQRAQALAWGLISVFLKWQMKQELSVTVMCSPWTIWEWQVVQRSCLAPLEVGEVGLVVEDDRLELDLALEEPLVVAALLEAALVLDLGPGLGFQVELRPVAADHDQAFHLGLDGVADAGRVMAGLALDRAVGRGLPALVERLHIMADRAELRRGGQLDRGDEDREARGQDAHGPILRRTGAWACTDLFPSSFLGIA